MADIRKRKLKQSKLPKPADFKEPAENRDSTARLIRKVVQLGQAVRRHRAEGNLRSLAPPTIYGYLAFLRMATALPHLNLQQVALCSVIGNASVEDRKYVNSVFNEVFGIQDDNLEDEDLGGNLF